MSIPHIFYKIKYVGSKYNLKNRMQKIEAYLKTGKNTDLNLETYN